MKCVLGNVHIMQVSRYEFNKMCAGKAVFYLRA